MVVTKEENRKAFEAWYQADIPMWSMRFHREDNKHAPYSFVGTEKAWQAWLEGQKAMAEFQRQEQQK